MGLYEQYRRRGKDHSGQNDQQLVNGIPTQREAPPKSQHNN